MKAYYKEHESWLFLLLLSLSLHTTLLVLFFILHPLYQPLPMANLRSATQDVIPLSQAPDQGATIIFQDEPEKPTPTPVVKDITSPTKQKNNQAQKIMVEEAEQHEDEFETPENNQATPEPLPTKPENLIPEPIAQKHIPDAPIAFNKVKIDKPKSRAIKKAQPSREQQTHHAAQALAKISQGFIQSMEQERGNTPDVQQDFDALARQLYASKVFRMLSNTVNCYQKKTHLNKNITTDATLIIQIDARGKLLDFVVEHPQKNREILEIEGILSTAARQAGLYPPIPASFKTDVMTLRCPVHIEGEEGFHVYRLYTR